MILARAGTVGSVDVRGAAPGTRETGALDPIGSLQVVDAIVLAGGSAYGLDAATGVVKWLAEGHVGHPVGAARVPIVPSAVLIDLWFGGDPRVRPGADCGYRAAEQASAAPVEEGNVGAGAGATVGKFLGHDTVGWGPMKAGIGSSAITLPNGLVVAAIVAVNAMGDIVDPDTGQVIAGVRRANGQLADARKLLRAGQPKQRPTTGNTTHRCGRDERALDEGAGEASRGDGARRVRASDLADPHARGRRHGLLARNGNLDRDRRRRSRRRARGRRHGRGDRARCGAITSVPRVAVRPRARHHPRAIQEMSGLE